MSDSMTVTDLYDLYVNMLYYWQRSPYSLYAPQLPQLVRIAEMWCLRDANGLYIVDRRRGVWPLRNCERCGTVTPDIDLPLTDVPNVLESARGGCEGCRAEFVSGPFLRCGVCGIVRTPNYNIITTRTTCTFCDNVSSEISKNFVRPLEGRVNNASPAGEDPGRA